jgi:5-methylcytosine-specific restriction endonuclease McrA
MPKKGIYHHSEETKRKIGRANSIALRGKKQPWTSERIKGKNNPNWKGGVWVNEESRYSQHLFRNAMRRARLRKANGNFTMSEWNLLKKQYGNRCPACGKEEPKIRLTIDHIIPLSKGGSNFIENIQPLCKNCNSKKYNKVIKF